MKKIIAIAAILMMTQASVSPQRSDAFGLAWVPHFTWWLLPSMAGGVGVILGGGSLVKWTYNSDAHIILKILGIATGVVLVAGAIVVLDENTETLNFEYKELTEEDRLRLELSEEDVAQFHSELPFANQIRESVQLELMEAFPEPKAELEGQLIEKADSLWGEYSEYLSEGTMRVIKAISYEFQSQISIPKG